MPGMLLYLDSRDLINVFNNSPVNADELRELLIGRNTKLVYSPETIQEPEAQSAWPKTSPPCLRLGPPRIRGKCFSSVLNASFLKLASSNDFCIEPHKLSGGTRHAPGGFAIIWKAPLTASI